MRFRRRVQYIFQDPFGSLSPRMTVFDILREPLVIHEVGDADYRADMAKELMRLVGLDPRFLNRYPHSFSGGQRQRIGIARALALKPDLVLCDEPVSALDVSIQAQILNLLKDLQAELGLTYLFISHNLAVVDYIADEIAVMCRGRIVEIAPREVLFKNPLHPYTLGLLAAVPYADLKRKLDLAAVLDGAARSPQEWRAPYGWTADERRRAGRRRRRPPRAHADRAATTKGSPHDATHRPARSSRSRPSPARSPDAAGAEEPPSLKADVEAGKLPPMAQRLPRAPLVVDINRSDWTIGRYGGELRTLLAKDRDIRMMVVYGYSRLVGYDEKLNLVPDILERVENVDSRIFTLHLRPGHRWSDGQPFTTADFRYFWEDVANDPDLSPFGLPQVLKVRDRGPRFEVLSETAVRYTWDEPNPQFLPALAGPSPLYIYRPAHYLRQFHPQVHRPRQGERAGQGGRRPQLGGLPSEEGRAVPLRQPRPADARAVDQHDAAAIDALRVRAQPVLPSRRQGGPAAALHRPHRRQHHRRQADPGQGRHRRRRPAGARPALRQLHVPQGEREAQQLSRPALGKGHRLAGGALPEPQRRGSRSGAR